MTVVCQNVVSIFAVHFFKRCWKLEKVQEGATEMIWEMEKMSYMVRLWAYQKKNLCWKCIHALQSEMPSAKELASLSEEDISRTGVQKEQPGKFRLEMRRAFLMLIMINHCNQRQSKMVDPSSRAALQRSGWLCVAWHFLEDCAGVTGWN